MKKYPSSKPALLPFSHFFLRTPLLPFKENIPLPEFNPVFNEAIYIASPEFYKEKIKFDLQGNGTNKMRESIYKYYTRASTRCTPFGLFAGCSVGEINKNNNICLTDVSHYKRSTRLDMDYLCALIRSIESIPEVREQLLWYPNQSIYRLGKNYRYVEYVYQGIRRIHKLCSVDYSEELNHILTLAQKGALLKKLAIPLKEEGYPQEEVNTFLEDIIKTQLLKSELEIGVTGHDPLQILLQKLEPLEGIDEQKKEIHRIHELLLEIDSMPIGFTYEKYDEIVESVKKLKVPFKSQLLFQVDFYKPTLAAEIATKITDDIYKCMEFLNSHTLADDETNLSLFKKAFYERYEDEEVPLLKVLDNEAGIGYLQNRNDGDINELIQNISTFHPRKSPQYNMSGLDIILWQKVTKALTEGNSTIDLSDIDYIQQQPHWNDIPDTISVLCSIAVDNSGCTKIHMKSVGGQNGAYLLARFGYLNNSILSHLHKIIQKEQDLCPDSILAEIVHLPEAHTGNILCRPILRKYEIPYLANAGVQPEFQLSLSQLTISLRNNRIVLYSQQLKKEIIPCLTNAHNYSRNSLSVYHFLCDLQNQQKRMSLHLNIGPIFSAFDHLPRFEYGNCILMREKWKIKAEEVNHAYQEKRINEWRAQRQLPLCVVYPESDNELFIDFQQEMSIQTLIVLLDKQKQITVEEFIFEKNQSIVKGKEGEFCNEVIISFYKNK